MGCDDVHLSFFLCKQGQMPLHIIIKISTINSWNSDLVQSILILIFNFLAGFGTIFYFTHSNYQILQLVNPCWVVLNHQIKILCLQDYKVVDFFMGKNWIPMLFNPTSHLIRAQTSMLEKTFNNVLLLQ